MSVSATCLLRTTFASWRLPRKSLRQQHVQGVAGPGVLRASAWRGAMSRALRSMRARWIDNSARLLGQIHLAQECLVTRIGCNARKGRITLHQIELDVFLRVGPVEPSECLILLAAERIDLRDA